MNLFYTFVSLFGIFRFNSKCFIMLLAELVKFNSETMKFLSENGILLKDYQYTDLYDEYMKMVKDNEKKEYIYAKLSEKYNIPRRTLLRIIKRLSFIC